MNQNARKYHQPVHKDLEHIVPRQTNQGKRSLQQFRNRRTLSEFTETARLDRLKREQNRRQKPKVVVLELPKKTETAPVFHSPKLTEQHKASTPFMGWINQKAVSPLLKVAAGAVILVSLGTVRPDFARAAPKPKPVPGVMEDGKKDTKAPTIFGQGKYFDSMTFDEKTGRLTIVGGRWDGSVFPMRNLASEITERVGKKEGKTFSGEGLPHGFVFVDIAGKDGYVGAGFYLIYEDAIFIINKVSPKGETLLPLWASDNSKIFSHEGAIYVDDKGNLLATTPTTLLAFTKNWLGAYRYVGDIFDAEKLPLLQRPTFQLNVLTGKVDLRDPIFVETSKTVKLTINLTKFEILSEQDDLVIGAR